MGLVCHFFAFAAQIMKSLVEGACEVCDGPQDEGRHESDSMSQKPDLLFYDM